MALDIYAAQKAANVLAARAGLTVKFHEDPDKFCTDAAGTLYIPKPDVSWPPAEVAWWRNGYSHEIGHQYPGMDDIFSIIDGHKIDMRSLFGAALNIVDDVRNDFNRVVVYPGTRDDQIVAWRRIAGENLPKQMAEMADTPDMEPANLATAVVMTASVTLRGDFDPALYPYATALQSSLREANDQAGEWFDTMQRDGWLSRWEQLKDAKQEYVFVRELLRDVFNVDEKDLPPEDPDDVQSDEGSKASDSGDNDNDKDGESTNGGKVTIDYEDLLNAMAHDSETRERGRDVRIDYSRHLGAGKYSPHTWDTTRIGYPESIINESEFTHVAFADAARLSAAIDDCHVDSIVHAARMTLQVLSRKLWSTNLKRGRLDTRKLAKLGTHDVQRQGQPEVFKLPGQRKTLDSAISVLVDASGSMMGDRKYDLAIAAAYGMLQICNTLHVPIEIAAFTEYQYLYHSLMKSWDEPRISKDTFLSRAETVSKCLMDNADGDSIALAYHRLAQRPEKKRVLLVLSDGQPASGRGDIYGYTKKVIKAIEAGKNIDIMGIGIVDNTVRNLYSNHRVITTANAIPSGLIEVLKNCITN